MKKLENRKFSRQVYVLGLWHQGLVASAVLSSYYNLRAIVRNSDELSLLKRFSLPINEPGLETLIQLNSNEGRLTFTEKSEWDNFEDCVVLIAHDLETDSFGNLDMRNFMDDFDWIITRVGPTSKILITSQVPVGTFKILENLYKHLHISFGDVVSVMPENLRLGNALERFKSPQLPVIGCSKTSSFFWELFFNFTDARYKFCSQTQAELLKHCLNSFLAMTIAFGNEIDRVAQSFGIVGNQVLNLLKSEPRVGTKTPMKPGLPFFGGTLLRDLQSLSNFSRLAKVDIPLIDAIIESNEAQKTFVLSIVDAFFSKFSIRNDSGLCLLGLTYTQDTSTLRDSPGLWLAKSLGEKYKNIFLVDPRVKSQTDLGFTRLELDDLEKENIAAFIVVQSWNGFDSVLSTIGDRPILDLQGFIKKDDINLPSNYHYCFGD